jgi:hypothetical protein
VSLAFNVRSKLKHSGQLYINTYTKNSPYETYYLIILNLNSADLT